MIRPQGVCFWLTIDLPGFFLTGGRAPVFVGGALVAGALVAGALVPGAFVPAAFGAVPALAVGALDGPRDLGDDDGADLRWAMGLPIRGVRGRTGLIGQV